MVEAIRATWPSGSLPNIPALWHATDAVLADAPVEALRDLARMVLMDLISRRIQAEQRALVRSLCEVGTVGAP